MPKLNLPSLFGGKKSEPKDVGPQVSSSVSVLSQGTTNVKDIIAPEAIEVDFSDIKINDTYYRTLFVAGYPRFVNANWLSPLINFPHSLSISMFIYPVDGKGVIEDLRRKIAEMEAELQGDIQRGRIINIDTQVKLEDARSLQEQLAKGAERFFQFGLYITIRDDKKDILDRVTNHIKSALGALLIVAKTASLQIEDGFKTTLPTGLDKLKMNRNMDTTSLATTFPFTSSELTANEGLMYGINEHNDSLVVFDRFTLENANMVVFAKSGSGKCLGYDEPTLIRQKGNVQEIKIGQYIDQAFKDSKSITRVGESEAIVDPEIEVLSYGSDLAPLWSRVEIVARKHNPYKELLNISTKSGRSITVTPDHQILTLENGEVKTVVAKSTKVGQYMPIARSIPATDKSTTLNLLDILKEDTMVHIVGAQDWIKASGYTGPYAEKYFGGRAFPITLYDSLKSRIGSSLPQTTKLQIQNSRGHTLPTTLAVTPDLAWLLGLYVAEGSTAPAVVIITNRDQEIRDKAENILKDLDFPYFVTPADIRISSSIFKHVVEAIGVGHTAGTKQFPSWAINLDSPSLASMIGGYLDGDGGTEARQITAVSKSKSLINSLALLLNRFGVHARIHQTQKRASNSAMAKQLYWRFTISGQNNLLNFAKKITFVHKEKQEKLNKINQDTKNIAENTNVEFIPGLAPLFKKLHEELFLPHKKSPGQNFINIKNGKYNPSPKELLKHLQTCQQQIKELHLESSPKINIILSRLTQLANSQIIWDPITSIVPTPYTNPYVYDLQVKNQVFLAGQGGIFVHNSYMVKLEILRSLLFDTEVIVIDPEDEYRKLSDAIGGTYIDFSFSSPNRINPFELPQMAEPDENELAMKIISLHSLLKIMMGDMNPQEEALLDRALVMTYQMKGINRDATTHKLEPPLMEDLYKVLNGMEEAVARGLADRLEKYVKGSFQGIFSQKSNVNFGNQLTVFGIKNLTDELRPTAIFIILDYIWTKVKRDLKRRLLVVDEAWYLMKSEDSSTFLYGIAKRARKYFLGLTTITQDVEDFLKDDHGKAIVSNASIQVLMKQSSSAIEKLATTFFLSQGERHLLLTAEVGEALFFAGQNHVAMKVVASPEEHNIITTNPQETLDRQKAFADKLVVSQQRAAIQPPPQSPTPPAPTPPATPVTSPQSPPETSHAAPPQPKEPTVPATPAPTSPTTEPVESPIFQQPAPNIQ